MHSVIALLFMLTPIATPTTAQFGNFLCTKVNNQGDCGPWHWVGVQAQPTATPTPSDLINVKSYGAIGDCRTDDTNIIQTALDAACARSSLTAAATVYLPQTPNSCYYITKPLRVHCPNLTIEGAGMNSSVVSPSQFYGPAFLLQSNPNNANQPFTTAVSWGAGNIFDGTANGGASLLDMSEASWPASMLYNASALTWEAEVMPTLPPAYVGTENTLGISAGGIVSAPYNQVQPGGTQWDAMRMSIDSNGRLYCGVALNGTFQRTFSPMGAVTFNAWNHLACVYSGSAILGFVNGAPVINQPAAGVVTSTVTDKIWFMGQPDGQHDVWPAYYAYARLSNTARYNGAFTPPTSTPPNDNATLYLLNFATAPAAGMVQGVIGAMFAAPTLYMPYDLGGGPAGTVLRDLKIQPTGNIGGGPAIWADWAYNSRYEHLSVFDGDTDYGIELWNNNFQSSLSHISLYAGPKQSSTKSQAIALEFGGQCGGCAARDVQIDGPGLTTAVDGPTDAGHLDSVRVTDRGSLLYPFISGGNVVYDSDFVDSEGNSAIVCELYTHSGWAPTMVIGGEFGLNNPAGTFLCVNGGQPIIAEGAAFEGSAANLASIVSTPANPIVVRDSLYPSGINTTGVTIQW